MFINTFINFIDCFRPSDISSAFLTNIYYGIHLSFSALSVQSSGGDSWTKQVSYTGSEPNSEVVQCSLNLHLHCIYSVSAVENIS